ncbi:MAG: TolB family protein, partial [Planctomycetota bacterium]
LRRVHHDTNSSERNQEKHTRCYLGALVALGRYAETDTECSTPPGLLTYHFVPWLAKYVANCLEAGHELALPDRTETGPTARLLRAIHSQYVQLRSKARRLIPNGAAADYAPDGQRLVCARVDPGRIWFHETPLARPQRPGSKGIDIVDSPTPRTIRSLVGFGHFPRWSPDGRYMAFVKSPFSFRSAFEQIYIIPAAGGASWHLGKGVLLGWSRDSRYIYYHRYREDWFIYKKRFDDPEAEPERIIYSPSYFPAISPDEELIAYEHRGEILITDLKTRETVATWRLPVLPVYYQAAWRRPMPTDYEPIPIEWSPTGRELSIGSELTGLGFWIYDLETRTASRVLPGAIVWGRWSRDGTKMALVVGQPAWEIWEVDIDPNRPTVESLGPGLPPHEHCREMIAGMEDWLAWWPEDVRPTLAGRVRAFCHAGLGQEDECVAALEKWLTSLSTWPNTEPPTYWQMARCLLDRYESKTTEPNAVLSLAAKMSALAQQEWAGAVLLGIAHYHAGSYDAALTHLERAEQQRVQSKAPLYPDQVAYATMTLHRLGRGREAAETLHKLRAMFPQATSYDGFLPLANAERLCAEGNPLLSAVWDHMERGYLDKAWETLDAVRAPPPPAGSPAEGAVESAALQLALRFAARGQAYEQRREYRMALGALEAAAAAAPWHAPTLDRLARLQATCPQAACRDGPRAVETATKACQQSQWHNHIYIDTLAAACAEAGRFDQAVEYQRQAITRLSPDTRPGRHAHYEAKLRLYQAGQSYHGQYLLAGRLVARYTFDRVDGTTVLDSSGNQIHGTLVGNARTVRDPTRGKVLELDGDGDWVDCGSDLLFGMAEEMTIAAWIKAAESTRP